MELNMEAQLYEAAVEGNVPTLLALLRQDKLLLDKFMVGTHTETLLHISAMLGHLEFVNEILDRKPELASEQDSQRSTPLHLAAAKGYLNIVKRLLTVNPDACFIHDRYERNPIHVAAIKGRADVLEHLVREKPEAARGVDGHGWTILHLCVKHNNLEALKISMEILDDQDFINAGDQNGNTILHLAAIDRQFKAVDFLLSKGLKPNVPNTKGVTALELLAQSKNMTEASEIMDTTAQIVENYNPTRKFESSVLREEDKRKKETEWPERMQQSIMVVAILLATMAFQASLTPPGGLWPDNWPDNSNSSGDPPKPPDPPHKMGYAIMGDRYPGTYRFYIVANTTSFLASLSIILLLISGLPMKRNKLSTWILMLAMWVAISFAVLTYAISVFASTPKKVTVTKLVRTAVIVWGGLVAIIFLYHIIRLFLAAIRIVVRKSYKKNKKKQIFPS